MAFDFMGIAKDFLVSMFQIGEGSLKAGFTTGGVSYTYNQANDTMSGSFTIPVTPAIDPVTGVISYEAKDAFDPPAAD